MSIWQCVVWFQVCKFDSIHSLYDKTIILAYSHAKPKCMFSWIGLVPWLDCILFLSNVIRTQFDTKWDTNTTPYKDRLCFVFHKMWKYCICVLFCVKFCILMPLLFVFYACLKTIVNISIHYLFKIKYQFNLLGKNYTVKFHVFMAERCILFIAPILVGLIFCFLHCWSFSCLSLN